MKNSYGVPGGSPVNIMKRKRHAGLIRGHMPFFVAHFSAYCKKLKKKGTKNMPKTEYEKGYKDGFSDGFSFCQKIYSSIIDIICKAFQKKEKEERKIISEQPKRENKRQRRFRDIPIDGSLKVGDIVYTKANAVLDIGIVKSVSPLEVYSRCTRYDYGYPSLYGAPELCHWYNSGVNVSFTRWREISYDAGTDDVCRAIGIPYLRC